VSSGPTSLLIVVVGLQLALQAPINSQLGRHVGRLAASLVSFGVGTAILLVLVVATGEIADAGSLGEVPFYQLCGGLIGASYVATTTLTVARIGAGAVVAATITGQLISSLLIDDLGLVGVDAVPVTLMRMAGAAFLVAGTVLIVRRTGPRTGEVRRDLLALVSVFVVGLMVGFQHPLNGLLAETTGDLLAGLNNFIVGTSLLAVIVIATGRGPGLTGIRQAPTWQLAGGLIGTITVVAALSAVSVIGAAGLTAALITGQLIGSIALDRVGAFGLTVRLITPARATGAALLLAGTLLSVS
jgi:transporter family-2 protein